MYKELFFLGLLGAILIHQIQQQKKKMSKKQTASIVIYTDLEPDDIVALWMLAKLQQMSGRKYWVIVVGEGVSVSSAKMELVHIIMQHLEDKYDVLGYRVYNGLPSTKSYPLPYFLRQHYSEEMEYPSAEYLELLYEFDDVYMFKPPREFIGMSSEHIRKMFGWKAALHLYGSFNIRTLRDEAKASAELSFKEICVEPNAEVAKADLAAFVKEALQKKDREIMQFIDAFPQVYWAETFMYLGEKGAFNVNDKELVEVIVKSKSNMAKLVKEMMDTWNTPMYLKQKAKVDKMMADGVDPNTPEFVRALKIFTSLHASNGLPQMVMADVLLPFMQLVRPPTRKVDFTGFSELGYPNFVANTEGKIVIAEPGHEESNRKLLIECLAGLFRDD